VTARRVRVQGDLFHGRVPDGAVYVGRSAPGLKASPYRNDYLVRVHGLAEASRLYLEHLASRPDLLEGARRELPAAGEPDLCHAALLLDVANLAEGIPAESRPAGS
jgi:hypothetical protein